jgi:hypothetical protein
MFTRCIWSIALLVLGLIDQSKLAAGAGVTLRPSTHVNGRVGNPG